MEQKHFSDVIRELNPDIESQFKILLSSFESRFFIQRYRLKPFSALFTLRGDEDKIYSDKESISLIEFVFSNYKLTFERYFDYRTYELKNKYWDEILHLNINKNDDYQINNVVIILEFMLMTINFFDEYILKECSIKLVSEDRKQLEHNIKTFIDEVLNYKIIQNS